MGVAQSLQAGEVRGGGLPLERKQVGESGVAGGHAGLGERGESGEARQHFGLQMAGVRETGGEFAVRGAQFGFQISLCPHRARLGGRLLGARFLLAPLVPVEDRQRHAEADVEAVAPRRLVAAKEQLEGQVRHALGLGQRHAGAGGGGVGLRLGAGGMRGEFGGDAFERGQFKPASSEPFND